MDAPYIPAWQVSKQKPCQRRVIDIKAELEKGHFLFLQTNAS